MITMEMYKFYQTNICCDASTALNSTLLTIQQSNSSEWFVQRALRITASNESRLKGQRFNVEKVVTDKLHPKITKNAAMIFRKTNEDLALKEFEQLVHPKWEIVEVGIIISLQEL